MVNIFQIFGKVLFNHKWPCLFYQDLCHENMDLVSTYLFYQVCKVHDIVCLRDQYIDGFTP